MNYMSGMEWKRKRTSEAKLYKKKIFTGIKLVHFISRERIYYILKEREKKYCK